MVLLLDRPLRYCCSMQKDQSYRERGRRHVDGARLILEAVRPKDDAELPAPTNTRLVEVVNHQGQIVRVPQSLSPLLRGRRVDLSGVRAPYRDEPAHVA